jgi:hypothetical protein
VGALDPQPVQHLREAHRLLCEHAEDSPAKGVTKRREDGGIGLLVIRHLIMPQNKRVCSS